MMLSDDTINRLAQPIIERQQQANTFVVTTIANRIKEIGEVSKTDVYRLERLYQTGSDVKKINTELARLTGLNVVAIKSLIKKVAESAYNDARAYYDYRNLPFIPFEQNQDLQNIVNSIANQTAADYSNLSNAQAFMLRDMYNPQILIPTPISNTYQHIIDQCVTQVTMGVQDYRSAMRQTVRDLGQSGIRRVTYNTETGRIYTQRLDTAVRRNILDGVKNINQGVQNEVGKQFGADGVEITVHEYPAKDHEQCQGHQFTKENYELLQNNIDVPDYNGTIIHGFERKIGTLNCRHFAFNVILGVSVARYNQEQLNSILQRNKDGYTDSNGKHLTMYECTQKQRQMETEIRYAKDEQIAARAAGDTELAKKAQLKINILTAKYNQFSNNCGIQTIPMNLTVSGYHKIKI